ncbi:hypothetical protein C7999DRAFT_27671 [Corynascus novoguineensis]|uniref:Uncharacterized protein n=1 Tax=Corynascus novoguineensis TaxID=1126955 RepID=A0AAN7HUT0_9PEZI|nr:hypothetical protein C7999DRAFT_27671 [Corynascus novoguineensis]
MPPAQSPVPTLIPGPIPDAVLRDVYSSDQDMYPVSLPYARLHAWVDACQDLSVCFHFDQGDNSLASSAAAGYADGGPGSGSGGRLAVGHGRDGAGSAAGGIVAGVVIVLPLRRPFWEDLLRGRVKEWEIEPRNMFAFPEQDSDDRHGRNGKSEGEEVGLHVYHIEKFGMWFRGQGNKRFSELALEEVMTRVQVRREWKIVGMSALTATPAGKMAFERLGFSTTGYKELFVAGGQGHDETTDKGPLEIVCVYPGDRMEPDRVAGRGVITSVSEMTAKSLTTPGID